MISAPAGAKLGPGAVFILFRHRADRPIGVQHRVLAAIFKRGTNAEARLCLNGTRKTILLVLQVACGKIEDGHFHAAGDIDADGIRNDGIVRGQHAADGQAIAHVRIRHQGSRHENRQQTGFLHLHYGVVFKALAPLAIFDRLGPRRRRRAEQRLGEFPAQRITRKGRRIGHDGRDFLVQARFVAATEDKFGDKVRRAAGGLTERNAEPEKSLVFMER